MILAERFTREMQPLLRSSEGIHGAVHRCENFEEAAEGIIRLARELPLPKLVMAGRRELDPVAKALEEAAGQGDFRFERDRKTESSRTFHEYGEFDAGIGGADILIAESATIGLVAGPEEARALSLLPSTHIVVAPVSRLVERIHEALARLTPLRDQGNEPENSAGAEEPPASTITFITGPSRTADIEKILVLPAHGPSRLYVWLVEDR